MADKYYILFDDETKKPQMLLKQPNGGASLMVWVGGEKNDWYPAWETAIEYVTPGESDAGSFTEIDADEVEKAKHAVDASSDFADSTLVAWAKRTTPAEPQTEDAPDDVALSGSAVERLLRKR